MSRMAGDALSDIKFDKGFSAEHLATLDQDKVKEALGSGGSWGWTDQARYNKLAGEDARPEGVSFNSEAMNIKTDSKPWNMAKASIKTTLPD